MKIKRIEHVAIAVADMAAFRRMLEETLGLSMEYEQASEQATLAMYPVADTYIEVIQGRAASSRAAQWVAQKGPGVHHLCLEVEDLEGALAELRARGARLLDERPRRGHGGTLIAFINPQSTADVLIELVQSRGGADTH